MNYAFSSPLKAVQGTAIRDFTQGQFGPQNPGWAHSPRRRRTELLYPSATSLKLSSVSVPAKPVYTPNQRPPPQVHSSRPNDAANQNEKSRKVVISRFLLVDGNITFAIGTKTDGIVTRDAQEVPVAEILDHVSPAELERFENQDFFDEDERERLLPPKKPRGRPRLGDKILPSFNLAATGAESSREQSLLPNGSILPKKRLGRPKGTFKKKAVQLTSTTLSNLSHPSTAPKRARGRPPRQRNLSVVIPAFNGPQPQNLDSTPGTESESDGILDNPKPQYSMITASGLGQSDTEDPTSRDHSVELGPSLKKRRLDVENAFIDPNRNGNEDDKQPNQIDRSKMFSDMSPDPIADDSTALLRQFQARAYGPDLPEKTKSIPHRQSKSSLSLDDGQFYTPRSSLNSSSSDSLKGHIPRRLGSLPMESVTNAPFEEESPHSPPRNISTKVPSPHHHESSSTVSRYPLHHQAKTPPTRSISPSKSIRRKVSFTPHFPPSVNFSHSRSIERSAQTRSQIPLPSASKHILQKSTTTTLPEWSKPLPSLPKKRKPSSNSRIPPSRSSKPSSTRSKVDFAGLPRAKDIKDYFAPKAPVSNPAPIKPRHSPSSQLLGPADTNSDSEDQLARAPSTDSDSIKSELMIVHQNPTAQAVTAEPRSQEPSSDSDDPSELDDSEAMSSEDEHQEAAPPTSNTASTSTTTIISPATKSHRTTKTLKRTFDLDVDLDSDDEGTTDSDSDPDTDTDSLSSEVMVIRPT